MIDSLFAWHPDTWFEYILLYISPGAVMVTFLLIKTTLKKPSDFANSILRIIGKEEMWIDKLKEFLSFGLGIACVLVGWPGLFVWLIKDTISDAALQKRYNEPDFICLPEYLTSKATLIDAESTSYVIDPLRTVPQLPFGHLNKGWVNFLSATNDAKDEMWSFYIPKGSEHGKYRLPATSDIRGYAHVRNGKVLAEFIYESD